jgi:hypothetical protein
MRRRSALALLSSFAPALAGCSLRPDGGTADRADHHVLVENRHDEAHEVGLTLARADETLVDESRALDPDAEWEVGTYREAGEYELTVRALGETKRESYALPLAEGDRESYAKARLTAEGDLAVRVYWQE